MDTRHVIIVSIKTILMQLHQQAMERYKDEVMDYLTPKKLNQLAEVYLADEMARRMKWAYHEEGILHECIRDIFSRAPWHKHDDSLYEDIDAHVYTPLQVMLYRMLDAHEVTDQTLDVWHLEPRPKNEYLLICKGDYRIHVWNRLIQNHRRTSGVQWTFDQGLYGFGITEAWHLPRDTGGVDLDHPGDD